jgi:hypothetical protein
MIFATVHCHLEAFRAETTSGAIRAKAPPGGQLDPAKKAKVCCGHQCKMKVHQASHARVSLGIGISVASGMHPQQLFMKHDIDRAWNTKLLLSAFEQMSSLKINYHKSELFCFGQANDEERQHGQLFGCPIGSYPFRYLGIPMHFRRLRNKDWEKIEERIEKKLSTWKGKYLLVGGRLVLINSILTSLPMFMLSFFEVQKWVLEKIDYFRSRFF